MPWDNGEYRLADGGVDGSGAEGLGEDSVREAFLANIPTGKFALPEEVADSVVFLCQDSSGMINGADIKIDGGYTVR